MCGEEKSRKEDKAGSGSVGRPHRGTCREEEAIYGRERSFREFFKKTNYPSCKIGQMSTARLNSVMSKMHYFAFFEQGVSIIIYRVINTP